MSDWFEIRVPSSVAQAEDVAARLVPEVPYATQGVELRGARIVFWVPAEERERALSMTTAAAARLADEGWAIDAGGVEAVPALPESEWRDAWKKYFHPTRLTRQLVVVPSWEPYQPEPDDLLLHLDPGQAFGTGAHASTQLVLAALQELADDGASPARILDIGTGSGILLIAAARLWPQITGLGTDIDPLAVGAAAENFERNGVADRMQSSEAALDAVGAPFELVVSNIQAHVLRDLAAPIAATVAPGGRLLLSGVLTTQAGGVSEAFLAHGFELTATTRSELDPEWSSLTLRRP